MEKNFVQTTEARIRKIVFAKLICPGFELMYIYLHVQRVIKWLFRCCFTAKSWGLQRSLPAFGFKIELGVDVVHVSSLGHVYVRTSGRDYTWDCKNRTMAAYSTGQQRSTFVSIHPTRRSTSSVRKEKWGYEARQVRGRWTLRRRVHFLKESYYC